MRAAAAKYVTEAQSSRIRRILDAARELIEQVGVEGMTMRDLAAASGVANATLYNRFGTKDNIIGLAVLDHYEAAIESGMSRAKPGLPPIEKLTHALSLFDEDIRKMRSLTHALMSAYFKLDGSREMPKVLYQSAFNTWLPILQEMAHLGALEPWVSVDLLCEEICDRQFGVVMKWSQGDIPDPDLLGRLKYSLLSAVMAASSGKQDPSLRTELGRAVRLSRKKPDGAKPSRGSRLAKGQVL